MSRLRIKHRTRYTYARPVQLSRHRLVLRPREGHDLRVLDLALHVEPAHHLTWTRDLFGNSVAIVDFDKPASTLLIFSDVTVERFPSLPRPDLQESWRVPFPIVYESMEQTVASGYQALTYPDDAVRVREWTERVLPLSARVDSEAMLLMLGTSIKDEIRYLRRSEKGVQSPARTLELGNGSCRDMATLMLEAARGLGIASRFSSGYLHCAASEAGRASTHAWMEAYLPTLGWKGFDPTLGEPASLKHVPIGVSNHPRGVMPVSGQFTGDRSDFLEMTVEVSTEALDG